MNVTQKARIAVMVSGGGTNLQALIDAQRAGIIKSGEICLVVSNNASAYAITRAELAGIPSVIVTKKEYGTQQAFEEKIVDVHPSLIPSFCGKGFYGLRVHEAALEYGVKVTGATVHFVNEIPDGGEIILQKSVSIKRNETPESLQQKVMRQAEWIILPKAAELISAEIVAQRKEVKR